MPIEAWRSVFEKPDTYFNGYFSETEITDLDEGYIGATITKDDLNKDLTAAEGVDGQYVLSD